MNILNLPRKIVNFGKASQSQLIQVYQTLKNKGADFFSIIKNYFLKFRTFRFISTNDLNRLAHLKQLIFNRRFFRFKPYSFLLRFNSVKFEISIIYTLILGVILLSFCGIFYFITSQTLYEELDNELQIKAQNISDNIRSYLDVKGEKPETLQYAVKQTIAREDENLRRWWYIGFERSWFKKLDEQDLSDDFIHFISLDKSLSIKSKSLHDDYLTLFLNNIQFDKNKEKFWSLDLGDEEIRIINYPFSLEDSPTHVIQIGVSKSPVIHLLNQWMISVLICIPIVLILTGFIGRLLASRVLRPLGRIISTARDISHENLNLRVKPKIHYQEMDILIETFNNMIERLSKSFKHIDEFSMHVAHELKTPLTIIRGEAELSYFSAESQENKKSMKVIIDEIDKVIQTVEDLLFLGKTCYQPDSFTFQDTDLVEFLQEIVDQFKWVAKGKNIQLKFGFDNKKITIWADKLHLRRLIFNLLDNAFKYTPDGGNVTVNISRAGKIIRLNISDSGIGISKENLPRIFEQFYREEQKGEKKKGVGLGLSIAQAIAKAHNGEIKVDSQLSHGTTFTVILPYKQT